MIVSTYTLGRKLQNKIATIHQQDWNVLSPRFGKYYLDISGAFRSENDIHNFHCENGTKEIEAWLMEQGYKKLS